ncbi:sigma-E factor negative regulatory protein [Candidatus Methylocalor cossyra]|uniref:Anti sigma-E protein RseA, N-terminal domain n=1 Tax=Candidatus Methylocalor cossyra TaxID=3108543 RepID=A0ABM9NFJ6_9GAMM
MVEDSLKEKLCLLLDGELGLEESLELLARIERDETLRAQWQRYCLIRESLKSGAVLLPDSRFTDRVRAALTREPAVVAPNRLARRRSPRKKWVAVALAASLAGLAVQAGRALHEQGPSLGGDLVARSDPADLDVQAASLDTEFRDYLVTHYETAYLNGAQGLLPPVRLVSSDARH